MSPSSSIVFLTLVVAFSGCGTVVEHQYYTVTGVDEQHVELPPTTHVSVVEQSIDGDTATVRIVESSTCRRALEETRHRELVTERVVVRRWLAGPAPLPGSRASLGTVLGVIAYAATLGIVDRLRSSTRVEPAEPETVRQGLHEQLCGAADLSHREVRLEIVRWSAGVRDPSLAFTPLGPRLRVERRVVRTDAAGRARVSLDDESSTLLRGEIRLEP